MSVWETGARMNCRMSLLRRFLLVSIVGGLAAASCQDSSATVAPELPESHTGQPAPLLQAETPVEPPRAEPSPPLNAQAIPPAPTAAFDPAGFRIGPGSGFVVLDEPRVIPGSQATWLSTDELVLGVVVGEVARAYPISQWPTTTSPTI
jgi:hypothetical protein